MDRPCGDRRKRQGCPGRVSSPGERWRGEMEGKSIDRRPAETEPRSVIRNIGPQELVSGVSVRCEDQGFRIARKGGDPPTGRLEAGGGNGRDE